MNKRNNYSTFANLSSPSYVPSRTIPVYAPSRTEARERIVAHAWRRKKATVSRGMFFFVVVVFTFSFCLVLNVKARREMVFEHQQQAVLQSEIEQIRNNNSALLEETRRLQSDPATIERVARQRANMIRPNEKVLVSDR